jgi:hypothetical protein
MHGLPSTSAGTAPRRFLLLAEEALDAPGRRPRVRRYRLASLGSRGAAKASRRVARMGRPAELPERI